MCVKRKFRSSLKKWVKKLKPVLLEIHLTVLIHRPALLLLLLAPLELCHKLRVLLLCDRRGGGGGHPHLRTLPEATPAGAKVLLLLLDVVLLHAHHLVWHHTLLLLLLLLAAEPPSRVLSLDLALLHELALLVPHLSASHLVGEVASSPVLRAPVLLLLLSLLLHLLLLHALLIPVHVRLWHPHAGPHRVALARGHEVARGTGAVSRRSLACISSSTTLVEELTGTRGRRGLSRPQHVLERLLGILARGVAPTRSTGHCCVGRAAATGSGEAVAAAGGSRHLLLLLLLHPGTS